MDHRLQWDPTTSEVKAIIDELRPLLEAMAKRDEEQLGRDHDSRAEGRTSSAMRPSIPLTKRPDSSVE
jgi:hypothetical protein